MHFPSASGGTSRTFRYLGQAGFGARDSCALARVDNLTIDNVKIDTNRDGIDVDACKNVRISNCTVNSQFDDAICPKSSYALGYARVTENVTITNCQVSGYDEGTLVLVEERVRL